LALRVQQVSDVAKELFLTHQSIIIALKKKKKKKKKKNKKKILLYTSYILCFTHNSKTEIKDISK
jgi:hypothetical protein